MGKKRRPQANFNPKKKADMNSLNKYPTEYKILEPCGCGSNIDAKTPREAMDKYANDRDGIMRLMMHDEAISERMKVYLSELDYGNNPDNIDQDAFADHLRKDESTIEVIIKQRRFRSFGVQVGIIKVSEGGSCFEFEPGGPDVECPRCKVTICVCSNCGSSYHLGINIRHDNMAEEGEPLVNVCDTCWVEGGIGIYAAKLYGEL